MKDEDTNKKSKSNHLSITTLGQHQCFQEILDIVILLYWHSL